MKTKYHSLIWFPAILATIWSSLTMGQNTLKVGDKFPEFKLTEIGKKSTVELSSLKGKLIVLDFWASWCGPCKQELPALDRLQAKYRSRGLEIIGINEDETEDLAAKFLKDHNVNFRSLRDENKDLADKCHLLSMPSTYIVDREGVLKSKHVGYSLKEMEKLEKDILKNL